MEKSSFTGEYGNIILNFQNRISGIDWDELDDSKFAMWQPSKSDKLFSSSDVLKLWNDIYEITKTHWSYISADLLKTIGVAEQKVYRTNLPDEFSPFALKTTDGILIIISFSKEKGIRLHFSEKTDYNYRINFLEDFLKYCTAWKDFMISLGRNNDEDLGFSNWWKLTSKVAVEMEEKDEPEGVGIITR